MEPLRHASVVRFGIYELALNSGELRKSGVRIRVQQQPLRVLEILLERPGEVIPREELRSRIWPEATFGDFDQAVNVAIAKLRGALGDSADNPRFIETIPRRGYRFIAEVSVVSPALPSSQVAATDLAGVSVSSSTAAAAAPALDHSDSRRPSLIAVIAILVLASAASWFLLRRNRAAPQTLPSTLVRSLAVLPLENLSSNAQDYFADGMTDELITDLAQISALRVISRTSVMPYKGVHKSLRDIARELNVDTVVEGTVLRSGKQVRITAQLIRAADDKHLWAQSYEGDVRDTLTLQKQVAREIAEQIRIKLTPEEEAGLQNVKAVVPDAYENYLKGRYFSNKRTADGLKKAADYFTQAVASDPNYALPHTGLADIYQVSDQPQRAQQEVRRALALDDHSAEAHNSLARLLYTFNQDWDGANREFNRAIQLNHNYAPAHHWYSMYLALENRKQEAVSEAQKAYQLDPLSPVVGANLAKILEEAGQTDKAIQQAKATLDIDPGSAVTHAVLGVIYQEQKRYGDAITEFKTALQLGAPEPETRGLLGYAYAASGHKEEAENLISDLKSLLPAQPHAALDIAAVYSGLEDKEDSLLWLEKAQQAKVSDLIGVAHDSRFASLQTDAGFQKIAQSVGPLH